MRNNNKREGNINIIMIQNKKKCQLDIIGNMYLQHKQQFKVF